jgi:hypothetical protein
LFFFVVKNEAAMLCEEASMPIEKLLERYGGAGCIVNHPVSALKKTGAIKTLSPVIRPKQNQPPLDDSVSDQAVDNGCNDSNVSETEDATSSETAGKGVVCKLADKIVNGCCNVINGDKIQDNVDIENVKNIKNDMQESDDKSKSLTSGDEEVRSDESKVESSTPDVKESRTDGCEVEELKESKNDGVQDVAGNSSKSEKSASVSSSSCSTLVNNLILSVSSMTFAQCSTKLRKHKKVCVWCSSFEVK